MCRQITCSHCKRPSWAGCGAHIEQVLAHVPTAERCACRTADPQSAKTRSTKIGWLQRLLGGREKRN